MIDRPPPPRLARDSALVGPARAVVGRLLDRVVGDGVVVVENGTARARGRNPGPAAPTVTVRDPRAWVAVLGDGSAGLGEGWFRGWWDTDDLVGLLRLLVRSGTGLDELRDRWAARTCRVTDRFRRLRRPNPVRDRAEIREHYDLGNDFFELLLDPTMTYSSAVFDDPAATLAEAQLAKLDGWCERLGIGPGTEVVEIGTGWGGFALRAAGHHGARVTTTTVSAAQHDHVAKLVAESGLRHLVTLLDVDYRDLEGGFDRLVSIEMIEAVDWRDHDAFFASVARLLRPDGLAGIQAIVIADQRYERAKNTTDFVKRWVFPGGCLPSVTAIVDSMTRATDLRVVELHDIGAHYARTLALWRANLAAAAGRLGELGLDEQFRRLFEFYLAYCEAAFRERHVSAVQLVAARPGWRSRIGAVTPPGPPAP